MSAQITERRSMSDRVAEEIRVMLVRRRMTGRQLAAQLNVSPSWVNYRLTGKQEIGLNDLERIAAVLDVELVELLPVGARKTGQATVPKLAPAGRPKDNRPGGRPDKGSPVGPSSSGPPRVRRPRRIGSPTPVPPIVTAA